MEVAFFILLFCILFGAFLWLMTLIDKEAADEAEARQKHGRSTGTNQ